MGTNDLMRLYEYSYDLPASQAERQKQQEKRTSLMNLKISNYLSHYVTQTFWTMICLMDQRNDILYLILLCVQ